MRNSKWLFSGLFFSFLLFTMAPAHATGPRLSDPAATYLVTCNTNIHRVMDGSASEQQMVDGFTCIGQLQGIISGVVSGTFWLSKDASGGHEIKQWYINHAHPCRTDYEPSPRQLIEESIRTLGRWTGNPTAGFVLGQKMYELAKGCGGV